MKHARLLVLLLVAGCARSGGSSDTSTLGHAIATSHDGPGPSIRQVDEYSVEAVGLPAISDDAQHLVFQSNVDNRGCDVTSIVVEQDASDARLQFAPQITIENDESCVSIEQSVAQSNALLSDVHRRRGLTTLTQAPFDRVDEDGDGEEDSSVYGPTSITASAQGIDFRVDDTGHVVISSNGRTLVDHVYSRWILPTRPMYPGAEPDELCENPMLPRAVWVDASRRVAVVVVKYVGDDSCEEPEDAYHLIRW